MSNTNLAEHENKPTSRVMTEWLEQQYDAAKVAHSGPEALAWDGHGLQMAARPTAAVRV